MRGFILMACLLALANCTRPTSGYSFVDLTRAAGKGLSEYHSWVAMDEGRFTDSSGTAGYARDKDFTNRLCLAGVLLEARLSDKTDTKAGVSLPLAAAPGGITTVLGYDLTLTEEDAGSIKVPMLAMHQDAPRFRITGEKKDKEADQNAIKMGRDSLAEFLRTLESRKADKQALKALAEIDHDKILAPPTGPMTKEELLKRQKAFDTRNDLAAELWRIREAIHDMVMDSPQGTILAPGNLEFVREYRLTNINEFGAKISLAGTQVASADRDRTITDFNRMLISFKVNKSVDQMRCDRTSIPAADQALQFPNAGLLK